MCFIFILFHFTFSDLNTRIHAFLITTVHRLYDSGKFLISFTIFLTNVLKSEVYSLFFIFPFKKKNKLEKLEKHENIIFKYTFT